MDIAINNSAPQCLSSSLSMPIGLARFCTQLERFRQAWCTSCAYVVAKRVTASKCIQARGWERDPSIVSERHCDRVAESHHDLPDLQQ